MKLQQQQQQQQQADDEGLSPNYNDNNKDNGNDDDQRLCHKSQSDDGVTPTIPHHQNGIERSISTPVSSPSRTPTTTTTESNNNNSNTQGQGRQRRGGLVGGRSPFKAIQDTMRNRRTRMRNRRKSHSAPPALRKPLIEQHFNVERNELGRTRVLPGAIKHEDDWNRDMHDYFNLIVLVPIVALNIMNWNWDILTNCCYTSIFGMANTGFSKKYQEQLSIPNAWTGDYFDLFFWVTLTYFVVDLIWIVIVPSSVKSPSVIFQHHIVTMLYILIPFYRPEVRWCMGACMSVEINTWFLIARRVFNKQGFPPWSFDLGFVSIRVKLISICFYVTWIAIRDILYPVMMGYIVNRWWTESQKVGTYINIEAIPPVLHAIFCILNLKWTYDLIMSKVRYFRRKGKRKIGGGYVDKGL
jgi:TLC domain